MPPTREITITIPTLEGVVEVLWTLHQAIIVEHSFLSGCALIVWSFYPTSVFKAITYILYTLPKSIIVGFLRCFGFGEDGVEPDSYASRYQSRYYGGHIPSDSQFAYYQSYGAIGLSPRNEPQEDEQGVWAGLFGWALFIGGIVVLYKYR
ncbi:hypothetical protein B0H34DRAFT_796567 [Crassisporium funariophilum]|nr:hypothetical protein B0H34DRAFT_796567 [Crassisporium funariophilum]